MYGGSRRCHRRSHQLQLDLLHPQGSLLRYCWMQCWMQCWIWASSCCNAPFIINGNLALVCAEHWRLALLTSKLSPQSSAKKYCCKWCRNCIILRPAIGQPAVMPANEHFRRSRVQHRNVVHTGIFQQLSSSKAALSSSNFKLPGPDSFL